MALSSVLDKNTEQWWCFDTAHVGLGDVNLGASSKVATESSVYFMYYFGGDYEETDVQAEFGLSNVRDRRREITWFDITAVVCVGVAGSALSVDWFWYTTAGLFRVGKGAPRWQWTRCI